MDTGRLGCAEPRLRVEAVALSEREKYERMWSHDEYRLIAFGEQAAVQFLAQAKPKPGALIIDFGAGTGRGAISLALLGDVKVHMLDFAANCLDEFVRDALTTQAHVLQFTQHDLTVPSPIQAEYGYCTDVMEHIPPDQVNQVLENILQSAQHVFFQIACTDDTCGALIGEPLHLSVHPYAWWLTKLKEFDCAVHWSEDQGACCLFYVTAWQQGQDFLKYGVLNIEERQLVDNVRINTSGDWKQAMPMALQEGVEVAILAGGPSLDDYADEIKAMKAAGVKIVTLNGAYNWAMKKDLWPVSTVIVDGRPFNRRFVDPVDERNMYLIASQCHPSVLEDLPRNRTYLWHTNMNLVKEILNERYDVWYNTPGGSTVLLRAIPLLRMLGFKKFHVYGADSCLIDDEHHAYQQSENDKDRAMAVTCGDRIFRCHPWMVSQASEFCDLVKLFGDEIELSIAGDGLLAHIVATGARMAEDAEIELP